MLNSYYKVLAFPSKYGYYYRFFFQNGTIRSYPNNYLTVDENALSNSSASPLFDYYRKAAECNDLHSDDGELILKRVYEGLHFISQSSILAAYLNRKAVKHFPYGMNVIFPFGCNMSQITAVRNALTSNISIIEGPPGTGKTQTILNIIANIIMNGKTVMVVSNNNTATHNVFEKLDKYGYSFIAAQMGSSDNKKEFIEHKQTPYPDFAGYPNIPNNSGLNARIGDNTKRITALFEKKNRLAQIQTELSELVREQKYFTDYYNSTFEDVRIFKRDILTTESLNNLWNELEQMAEQGTKPGFIKRIIFKFRYGLVSTNSLSRDIETVIAALKKLYYEHKISELEIEVSDLSAFLEKYRMDSLVNTLISDSVTLFRSYLRQRYDKGVERPIFKDDYWKKATEFLKEYPVLLSTTFSSSSCFKGHMYDYVIVDEASQVDLPCGILAMSCAKNIVIVGDLKQLPNVITSENKERLSALSEGSRIPPEYRCEENSLLSSVCKVFADAPRTLLKEHYRCHPKIINFCSKKFYNEQLVIMTHDNGENDVLKAHITTEGNHSRDHYNQRQIDEIKKVILPELQSIDVGIISPYNNQKDKMEEQIQGLSISTVHKFQGMEKDDIIISTVDNEITEFSDDPNMLNVAVSRAKKRLRIVVSDNEKNKNTNIGELVRYIQYNNFEVQQSNINSIFDLLYKGHEQKRREYLQRHKKVSEYDSENLMQALIEDILKAGCFSHLDVVSHYQLSNVIRDPGKLNEEERRYVMNPMTHLDFVIFDRFDKTLVLTVEVDGYDFHKKGTRQHERDEMKNTVLDRYEIPFIRFSTVGSGERELLTEKLKAVFGS